MVSDITTKTLGTVKSNLGQLTSMHELNKVIKEIYIDDECRWFITTEKQGTSVRNLDQF